MYKKSLLTLLLLMFSVCLCAAPKRKSEPLRVACVGNSVTYGYGLAHRDKDAYPVQLQRMLDATYGSGQYEVANFGHSGTTLLRRGHRPYVEQQEFHQALDFRPDWVVIHLGLNDTDPRNWPDWKEDFIPDYRALIDSFQTANPQARVLICLMTPIFDRHSRFESGTRDWHAQIQEAIRVVAHGADVQLIDLYSPLHSRPDLFPDALHPNPEGAGILARTVYGALTGDHGGLQLPILYGDGMVLQRDMPLEINGKADARQLIRVELKRGGKVVYKSEAFSQADGCWSAPLDTWSAGGPYTLTVTSTPLSAKEHVRYPARYPVDLTNLIRHPQQQITLDSVYFGDLWLASGQSNMELRVDQCNTQQADLADAARLGGRLRLFNMPACARTDAVQWPDSVLHLTNELQYLRAGGWQTASPQSVASFSAVAFGFGRTLCDSLPDVPIGIICNAVGGSTTESWIDRTTLEYQYPAILRDWLHNDHTQAWARGRAAQNIALALNSSNSSYNPLQRHPYEPCYLFEAAIQPLESMTLKGIIWYQGESNAHNVELHERLFHMLEHSWRTFFQGQLPIYFVQLSSLPRPSWPSFRDSQRRLADELPRTWMAVTTDLGDRGDVHYRTKRPVGERLALQALHHTYGHRFTSEGPAPLFAARNGTALEVHFDHAKGLAVTRGFEIAGDDGIYHPATIEIDDDLIRLTSPQVTLPTAVRYGWSGFTDADLTNSTGLPASTFQLDVVE